jgi:flagellar biosynthesis protein FlhA
VGEEADFFGSMDGASKFVRGDAMAGMLILFINIVGGFVIGVAQHDPVGRRRRPSYILLAVGDALVAQIPALLISVAAAMVVSRVGKEQDIGAQIGAQVFVRRKALGGHRRHRRCAGRDSRHAARRVPVDRRGARRAGLVAEPACALASRPPPRAAAGAAAPANAEASWDDLHAGGHAGPGGRLPADRAGGQGARRRWRRPAGAHQGRAQEVRAGRRLPAAAGAHPRQPRTQAQRYRVSCAARWWARARPSRAMLAINPGGATQQLPGTATTDPAFGLPAVWIDERHRELAQMAGFTVVDCATVVATHLSHLMQ